MSGVLGTILGFDTEEIKIDQILSLIEPVV
jgi:hypothetical protein